MLLERDPQELLLVLHVPDANLVLYPNSEDLAEAGWEADTGHRVSHGRHEARNGVEALATFH